MPLDPNRQYDSQKEYMDRLEALLATMIDRQEELISLQIIANNQLERLEKLIESQSDRAWDGLQELNYQVANLATLGSSSKT